MCLGSKTRLFMVNIILTHENDVLTLKKIILVAKNDAKHKEKLLNDEND